MLQHQTCTPPSATCPVQPRAVAFFLLLTLAASTGCQGASRTQPQAMDSQKAAHGGVAVNVLRSDPSGEPNTTISLLEVVLDPMAGSPPHRHPGPVTGCVLAGTFVFQVGDKPQRVLHAGDTFFEPTMVLHKVGRNPASDTQTRVLVTMVHPTDAKQLVIFEPNH